MFIPILSSLKLIRLTFCIGEILFAPVFKYGKISSRTLIMNIFNISSVMSLTQCELSKKIIEADSMNFGLLGEYTWAQMDTNWG